MPRFFSSDWEDIIARFLLSVKSIECKGLGPHFPWFESNGNDIGRRRTVIMESLLCENLQEVPPF
jgi:hypothetical protein